MAEISAYYDDSGLSGDLVHTNIGYLHREVYESLHHIEVFEIPETKRTRTMHQAVEPQSTSVKAPQPVPQSSADLKAALKFLKGAVTPPGRNWLQVRTQLLAACRKQRIPDYRGNLTEVDKTLDYSLPEGKPKTLDEVFTVLIEHGEPPRLRWESIIEQLGRAYQNLLPPKPVPKPVVLELVEGGVLVETGEEVADFAEEEVNEFEVTLVPQEPELQEPDLPVTSVVQETPTPPAPLVQKIAKPRKQRAKKVSNREIVRKPEPILEQVLSPMAEDGPEPVLTLILPLAGEDQAMLPAPKRTNGQVLAREVEEEPEPILWLILPLVEELPTSLWQ